MLKVIWGLPAESPKRVSRTVQTLFRTGGNCLKRGFAPCKRLFWESHPGGPKTPFAPSLSTFGHFGCAANIGSTLPSLHLLPTFRAGCISKSTVTAFSSFSGVAQMTFPRAELKVTDGNLRFSAVSCVLQFSRRRGESAKICVVGSLSLSLSS